MGCFTSHEIGGKCLPQPQHQQIQGRLSLWNTRLSPSNIKDSSTLGDYESTTQVSPPRKYPHDQTKPVNKGSLCGIMCGRNIYS